MKTYNFNAHHSPIGAFSSLTLGYEGKSGGLGLELGAPANQNFYVGLQQDATTYYSLPFFEGVASEADRYDVEKLDEEKHAAERATVQIFPYKDIKRNFQLCSDTFSTNDLSFTIYNQVTAVPDPESQLEDQMKKAIVPAIWLELTVDNTDHTKPRRAFIGYTGNDPYYGMRHFESAPSSSLVGVGQGCLTALASIDPDVYSATGFTMEMAIAHTTKENNHFFLGNAAALVVDVPAGEKRTYRFVASFFRSGIATATLPTQYYYTKYFNTIEDVSLFALNNYDEITRTCLTTNNLIKKDTLSQEQQFMLAHSIRSYYGSTQFLMVDDKPLWVVNEGEYRMMNTFDLTVDQLFYEMKFNPWTVKNELDLFTSRYSYYDTVSFPGDATKYPGGISFTHDMGVSNVFSRPQYSSYELQGLTGCFSYMTHEQLINWVCTAAVYYEGTKDVIWLEKNLTILKECFVSMVNRDHPEADKRNGVMKLDSSRTNGGAEITTYDSLDVSLGQARNNIYIAGKCFSAYLALEKIFAEQGLLALSQEAELQATRCANTLIQNMTVEGYIPAVINEGNTSRIIPAIEGLVFPYFTGCESALSTTGKYKELILTLKNHLSTVLVKNTCLFDDGGWKLSSTSNNSWLSKIYLNQFIAHHLLDLPRDSASEAADKAHVEWLLHPQESYWSWSDQMISGVARGSKYYPRGVTSILWLLY